MLTKYDVKLVYLYYLLAAVINICAICFILNEPSMAFYMKLRMIWRENLVIFTVFSIFCKKYYYELN